MTSATELPDTVSLPGIGETGHHGFHVELRDGHFHTLRASLPFACGALLIDLSHAETLAEPNYASIDLHDHHVLHPLARFINHSCAPTTFVDVTRQAIMALRNIQAGEEITFNYLSTERRIVSPFDCNCGSTACVGRVEKRS